VIASAGSEARAEEAIQLRDRTDKNVVYMWTGARSDNRALPILEAAGVPIFYTPATLARGLKSLQSYHAWRDERLRGGFASAAAPSAEQRDALSQLNGQTALSEFDSKRLIAAWGVPITREVQATSADNAVAAAEQLGYPVVVKVDSAEILHKTEAGAVRLGLTDAAQVRNAYADVMARAAAFAPHATIKGVVVQEMVTNGVEVIVGLTLDDQLGPMLMAGSGGVLVEVYQDVALRRCPIGHDEALAMISELKGARLLRGFRGRLPADIPALGRALVAISHLGVHLEGAVAELDINPLMVLPEGEGVKAADALVVLKGAGAWSRSE
jgi:acetyltransferase